MSIWGQTDHASGQALADALTVYRPFVGRLVRVVEGRKHHGKIGHVVWHGRDQFNRTAFRYGDPSLTEVCGTWGYRIGIQTDHGEKFFIGAHTVFVCVEQTK